MTDTRAPKQPRVPVFDSGFCDNARRPLILLAAIVASAMGFIDGSVTSIAMPAIRETLGATLVQVQWINNAYMLALSALVLVGGAFGDRYGLARFFGAGIVLFVAASMLCAFAPTAELLIAARALQGIGAALMVPGSLAIIARAYPREIRGAAIGTWAAASSITTAAGPIVGGMALTFGGPEMWRWIFAVNLPLGMIAIWALMRAVERDGGRSDNRPDIAGAVLATLGLGLIAWGLTRGQDAPREALLYSAAGLCVMVVFVRLQARLAHPMMDLSLFALPAFSTANVAGFFLYFSMSTITFFLPMVLIAGWGVSEIDTAAMFAPLAVFIGGFSRRVGRLADRFGNRPFVAAGSALVAIAFALLTFAIPTQDHWLRVLPAMCLMGAGMALVVSPISSAVMGAVSEEQSGTASGINNAVSRLSGLVAVAAMGSIAAIVYFAAGGSASFGAEVARASDLHATHVAFVTIAWIASALAALSAVIAWFGLPAGASSTG